MSIRLMSAVWEHAPCDGANLLVLLALADWSDDNGLCWPSIPMIAQKCRLEMRHAYRVIARLQKTGLISIEKRGGGRALRNHYRLSIGNPATGNAVSVNAVSKNTVSCSAKTLSPKTQNPDICATAIRKEPSVTTKEPSGQSKRILERAERDRRAGLTEAARRGLRDYEKHPLESWETQGNPAQTGHAAALLRTQARPVTAAEGGAR